MDFLKFTGSVWLNSFDLLTTLLDLSNIAWVVLCGWSCSNIHILGWGIWLNIVVVLFWSSFNSNLWLLYTVLTIELVQCTLFAIFHLAIGLNSLNLIRARRCSKVSFMDSHILLWFFMRCWACSNIFENSWCLKSTIDYFSILHKRRLRNEVLVFVGHYLSNIFVCRSRLSNIILL